MRTLTDTEREQEKETETQRGAAGMRSSQTHMQSQREDGVATHRCTTGSSRSLWRGEGMEWKTEVRGGPSNSFLMSIYAFKIENQT